MEWYGSNEGRGFLIISGGELTVMKNVKEKNDGDARNA